MRLQVFDLDGTLVRCNSFHLWIRFVASRLWYKNLLDFAGLMICLARRALKLMDHAQMKQRVLQLSEGVSGEDLERFCDLLMPYLHPEVLKHFNQAKETAWTCLNTAAPEFYARPFGRRLGFELVLATPPPQPGWRENLGAHKVEAVRRHFPEFVLEAVYSDEAADLPLMRLAQRTYLVNPKKGALEAIQAEGIEPTLIL